MAAIVQARKVATLAGAPPPTAKELHAAVSEPLHANPNPDLNSNPNPNPNPNQVSEPLHTLPPTSLAAVKKCMSLLVAMQRAGTPLPTAGD
eukprot:scaffold131078_cov45-Phaeocystis_antarctica.AAC.1